MTFLKCLEFREVLSAVGKNTRTIGANFIHIAFCRKYFLWQSSAQLS